MKSFDLRCYRMLPCLLALAVCATAHGQVLVPVYSPPPGVYLDADGKVQCRQVDSSKELAAMRARARAAAAAAKDPKLAYVSLPKLFAELRACRDAKKDIPDEIRFLGGLTQIQYVFVYPEDHDLIIAGPAEPWHVLPSDGDAVSYAVGTRTAHPILQVDDLIVAFRTAQEGNGRLFGCGIYPSPDSLKIADEIQMEMALRPRSERMKAMAERLGPQEIRIFGQRNDTRFAYICVAADYELKRFAMGLDHAPIASVGNGVDHSRTAADKFWFEASYEPLRVAKDGNAYEIRGQRLLVNAGALDFDPRGATEKAMTFAGQFTKNMAGMATAVPLIAELQNVADESLLANLIRRDKLAQRIDWDESWLFDTSACPVATVPMPRTAQTLVGYTSGSIVAGGVMFEMNHWVSEGSRESDGSDILNTAREPLDTIRKGSSAGAVVMRGS